jgi:hypothetical protein
MVHWIDSKASFGDDRTHAQQTDGQYATYVNRYGPGCVIYWFGFIADLSASVQQQQQGQRGAGEGCGDDNEGGLGQQVDVVLRDSFPGREDILQLPSAAAHDDVGEAAHQVDASKGVPGVMPEGMGLPVAALASC